MRTLLGFGLLVLMAVALVWSALSAQTASSCDVLMSPNGNGVRYALSGLACPIAGDLVLYVRQPVNGDGIETPMSELQLTAPPGASVGLFWPGGLQ